MIVEQIASDTMLVDLLQQYGITGLAFATLLTIVLRQNKNAQERIENLESSQQAQHEKHLEDQKEMINEYVELVKNKTRVLADLTGCLKAMKDTLERMDRKS
jgi:uncharacterized coiled-coil protein SlyX